MANMWDAADDDNESGNGGLREYVKKLEKENKEFSRQLAELSKTNRQRTIAEVLGEKKLDKRIAALIPADVESTPDAVSKWLEDYGSLFVNASTPAEEPAKPAATEAVDNPEFDVDPAVSGAMGAISKATAAASAPGADDLMARVMAAKSREELESLINAAGGGYGMG